MTTKSSSNKYRDPIINVKPKLIFSDYQKAVFEDIANGTGHTLVVARAGSSKTTTLVEGAKYIPKNKTALFCAFNSHIQKELSARLPTSVNCSTIHSLGFAAVRQRFGKNITLDNRKCFNVASDIINDKNNYELIDNVSKTANFCKLTLSDTPKAIEDVIYKYGIDTCDLDLDSFISFVSQTLRQCKTITDTIDYTDMVWFPFVYKLNVGKFGIIFIDEFQDLSKLLIELVISAIEPNGRLIVVADPLQAIFSFAGADTESFESFRTRMSPKELTLPICYRCPKASVRLAQQLVPDIQVYDKAIEGDVFKIDHADMIKYIKPGDFLISRYNAPLISNCFMLLKNKIPANILGRDIGEGLLYLIKKSKKKKVVDFLKWLDTWEKHEKEKVKAKFAKNSIEAISDKADCLQTLCQDMSTMEEVKQNITKLFAEKGSKSIVILGSIHKIKGLEADNVFVLEDTLRYFDQTENNLVYIARTRNKKALYLVNKSSKISKV